MIRHSLLLGRRRCFSSITDIDSQTLESIVGPKGYSTDNLEGYNKDWTGEFIGNSKLVLKPTTIEEISSILKYCNEKKLSIVPQSGNTGLVGGSIPIKDEIILSMKRMNQILSFDDDSGLLTCETGVILQHADEFVRKQQFCMPLDLGSKGSCLIGGNIATNAGGVRFIKYGSLRSNVLGLKVVLSDGRIFDCLRSLRKDNVGFDLKQLFIGSEGTLGIITHCKILTPPLPNSSVVTLLGVNEFSQVIDILKSSKQYFGGNLSAYEYFDENCMKLITKQEKTNKNPLNKEFNFYVLFELVGQEESLLKQSLINFLSKNKVVNGVISENVKQYEEIWKLRETITISLRSTGKSVYKYDVSLPMSQFNKATQHVESNLKSKYEDLQVYQYGHVGDGNLHFNATYPKGNETKQVQLDIESSLYSFIKEHNGSISAEHGVGQLKAKKVLYSRNQHEIDWMKKIKKEFDPNNILNPGKVLV